MSNFLGWFFHVFKGKKEIQFSLKNIAVSALKSYIKWNYHFFFDPENIKNYFLRANTQILKSQIKVS